MTILLVVAIFASLVLVHELGHFLAARRAGVGVEEFGIGFPPRLIGKQFGKTLYSINLLPLGGFVRLKGEDTEQSGPDTFTSATLLSKTKILLAGVGMNLATAYVLLLALCLSGLPPLMPGQFSLGTPKQVGSPEVLVGQVTANSPASSSGIKKGDILESGNGAKFTSEQQVKDFSKQFAGQTVGIQVRSGNSEARSISVKLRNPDSTEGFLGVAPIKLEKFSYGWWSPLVALGLLGQLAWGTLAAFGGLIVGLVMTAKVSGQVAGPVGIVQLLSLLLPLGISYAAVFVASISVSLAVINALPLPALDGGRLAIIWGQRILKRELSPKLEALIHTTGFTLLIALMVVVTYFDLKRLG